MKFFSKKEIVGLIVIFVVLVMVSWPNFSLSFRRSRDQIRRDDIGNINAALDTYYDDYGMFPLSTEDGRIIACAGPENDTRQDANGRVIVNLVACNWGKDNWKNLTPGVNKIYMNTVSGDPQLSKGISYKYYSDGGKYQLLASLESADEPGYDSKLAQRQIMCGNRVCNMGRSHNITLYITIEEYNLQIYCGKHPNDTKCIK